MDIFLELITWNIPTLYLLCSLFDKSHYWILDNLKWSNLFFPLSHYNFLSLCLFCSILWEICSNFLFSLSSQWFPSINMHLIFFFTPEIFLPFDNLFFFTNTVSSHHSWDIFCSFLWFSAFCFLPVSFFPIYLIFLSLFREGNSTSLQYSCLQNPMDGGAWKAAVHGVAEGRTRLSDFTFTFHFHALEKEMATHSSVLAWRVPGTGEPGGLPSMGSHRVRHEWHGLA